MLSSLKNKYDTCKASKLETEYLAKFRASIGGNGEQFQGDSGKFRAWLNKTQLFLKFIRRFIGDVEYYLLRSYDYFFPVTYKE